jgi:hypothetical protein
MRLKVKFTIFLIFANLSLIDSSSSIFQNTTEELVKTLEDQLEALLEETISSETSQTDIPSKLSVDPFETFSPTGTDLIRSGKTNFKEFIIEKLFLSNSSYIFLVLYQYFNQCQCRYKKIMILTLQSEI